MHETTEDDAISQVAHQLTDVAVLPQDQVVRSEEVLPVKNGFCSLMPILIPIPILRQVVLKNFE